MQYENPQALLDYAQSFAGFTLGELCERYKEQIPQQLLHKKGWVGQFLEMVLGATSGSLAQPDFPEIGVEANIVLAAILKRFRWIVLRGAVVGQIFFHLRVIGLHQRKLIVSGGLDLKRTQAEGLFGRGCTQGDIQPAINIPAQLPANQFRVSAAFIPVQRGVVNRTLTAVAQARDTKRQIFR
mgnify:CR=1 FL=1